ncbi:Hypothetical predicted protein [Podarcis lilfordi]|uniref:Uncharacterized protein n=1 Tax=Podarcis lilfordi TaxID=74358 RepID=A0AA35KTL8_9SAUR|nr:Hypothetical predicted protein [Podarcis lilfordi]
MDPLSQQQPLPCLSVGLICPLAVADLGPKKAVLHTLSPSCLFATPNLETKITHAKGMAFSLAGFIGCVYFQFARQNEGPVLCLSTHKNRDLVIAASICTNIAPKACFTEDESTHLPFLATEPSKVQEEGQRTSDPPDIAGLELPSSFTIGQGCSEAEAPFVSSSQ